MTIHLADGKDIFLNFREKAPLATTKNMYLDEKGNVVPNLSLKDYLAVGIPGTVMGLNTALRKYGTMPLAKVMAPAIKLAEEGYVLNANDADILKEAAQNFITQPNVAAIFLKDNKPYQANDKLVQTNLASTLKKIANKGDEAFYQGDIADSIVKASQEHGGILSKQDFLTYTVEELAPIRCSYHDYTIISAPPPSSGGITLCEILNIVEGYPLAYLQFHSAKSVHYLVEAMRYAYYDRNNALGDPDFVANPVTKLISKEYAAQIRQHISDFSAGSSSKLSGTPMPEGTNTTHYSIVDNQGNAVSATITLNNRFGARVIASDTGFFLNDEMNDFTAKVGVPNMFGLVQGISNAIAPGKRPLSSMTPTIVTKNDKVFMVLGSPGGSTIITAVLQAFLNVVDYGMDIKSAVEAPRFHFQWLPDEIIAEDFAFSADTKEKLATMGYQFNKPKWPLGYVEAIAIDPINHTFYGASDDRLPMGQAIGY